MASIVLLNGVSYPIPAVGDSGSWGTVLSNYFVALGSGVLQKAGGTFTLTADANFGPSFGLFSSYFTSTTANPAQSGIIRLAKSDSVAWRNNANGADIALAKDTTDSLSWNGHVFLSSAGVVPFAAGGTGLSSGTSGGVVYFSSTSALSSSALLAQYGVVVGGGAGAAPATLTPNASTAFPLVSGGSSANPSWVLLSVAGGGTGLAAGTSGGIPYFSSGTAMASSGALTASQLVIGGGAGTAPGVLAAGTQYQSLVMGASVPGYAAVALNQGAAVAGQLPVGNGGTGLAAGTSGGIPYFSTTAAISSSAALAQYGVVLGGGAGNAPATLAPNASTAFPLVSAGASANPVWALLTVAGGGTGVNAVTVAPAATSFAGWDTNKNLSANNVIDAYATTPTAGGISALTVSSASIQYFTGTTTQTVPMPVTSTLVAGMQWTIVNQSTGVVTVQSSGGNTIQAMAANTQLVLTCASTAGTGIASWTWVYSAIQNALGGGGTVTSVAMTVPTGFSVTGSPILTNGTLALAQTNFTMGIGGTNAPGTGTTNLTSANYGQIQLCNTASGAFTFNLPAPASGALFTFKDSGGNATVNNITLHRAASEKIAGVAADYAMQASFMELTVTSNGTDWFFVGR